MVPNTVIESPRAPGGGSNDPIIGSSAPERFRPEEEGQLLERFFDRFDGGAEVLDVHLILDRLAGVQHGGVITTAPTTLPMPRTTPRCTSWPRTW